MTIEFYRQLFTYDDWGNRRVLDSLRMATLTPSSRACAILAHLVGAGRMWLDRIHGRAPTMDVWPDLTLDRCEAGFGELAAAWSETLGSMEPADLGRKVAYVNTKGERWESGVGEVLMHVVLHATYHRGQIAILVRQAGHAPAYTDFIEAARRGHLKS